MDPADRAVMVKEDEPVYIINLADCDVVEEGEGDESEESEQECEEEHK